MTELTIDQALQQGIEAHKAGQVQEADRLYTAILKAQPKHPDANHNMGVLAVGVGKVEQALPFFKTALEANPATAQFWLSYIDALIKLDKLADAKAVLNQAKSKGAKGDGFNQLEQSLQEANREPAEGSTKVSELQPKQPNILDTLKLDQALKLAKKKVKEGPPEEAKRVYMDILEKFPQNKRAIDGLKALVGGLARGASKVQDPPQNQVQSVINLYNQGQIQQALTQAESLVEQFPKSAILFIIQGAALKGLGQLELSVDAYHKALAIKPDYADAYTKMGVTLKEQGKLKEAIEAYNKAIAIKTDNAEAYYNMGIALKAQGKLEEARETYRKALAIKPHYANALNNMGLILQEQGKLEEAIETFSKALAIKPDHADAYNNMGNSLKEQGKVEKAIEAYNKALAIKPDYAEAHRHLSALTKFTPDSGQISVVDDLLQRPNSTEPDRCHLHYTYAKIKEDLGDLSAAFSSYVAGGALRKKLLAYEFSQDQNLFSTIKNTAPKLKDIALNATGEPIRHTPIFILGMPRSGTTLVEQIISSHSEVTGAGELPYVSQYGGQLAAGLTAPTVEAMAVFRNHYLKELTKRANGQVFVTDKMPHNFRYIALICAAFP
ncbi:tetratricopeptide repeat protein, partial [Planktomarina temperata]|nr:tetratricopeptide repeat protein [Planktomarina temperata]